MAENDGRTGDGTGGDLVEDALRLVDGLQRRLLVAGVKRGVGAVVAPPPPKGDVWEEAIRLETATEPRPALEEVLDIVRTSAPEIAGHLGRAGLAVAGALGRTWGVLERSLEQSAPPPERAAGPEGGSGRTSPGSADGE
ncbi:hypothetical protein [Nocardiopsis algeriensis]|uniref:Uncharacterized protein n=1 Tax=Nocardiopsis algeriensis TaxID=1478215 RepID=A0A841IRR6_9ACTN|nr:hypothetical protein [Nocardiopsis algeriensis]MBB6119315.1 hypothetical protein [Nocardiopsis algeriensis]